MVDLWSTIVNLFIFEYSLKSSKTAIKNLYFKKNHSLELLYFADDSEVEYSFCFCENLQIINFSEESKLKSCPLKAFASYPEVLFMLPSKLQNCIDVLFDNDYFYGYL